MIPQGSARERGRGTQQTSGCMLALHCAIKDWADMQLPDCCAGCLQVAVATHISSVHAWGAHWCSVLVIAMSRAHRQLWRHMFPRTHGTRYLAPCVVEVGHAAPTRLTLRPRAMPPVVLPATPCSAFGRWGRPLGSSSSQRQQRRSSRRRRRRGAGRALAAAVAGHCSNVRQLDHQDQARSKPARAADQQRVWGGVGGGSRRAAVWAAQHGLLARPQYDSWPCARHRPAVTWCGSPASHQREEGRLRRGSRRALQLAPAPVAHTGPPAGRALPSQQCMACVVSG